MPRLRRETRRFKQNAINSLLLAIELFNRPQDTGRTEAVLIFLQHAFEMLLKAAIYQKRGTIVYPGELITHGFDRCLGISRGDLHILDEEEALTLSNLDGLRDCATHNYLDLTEQSLYIHTQAAVTLFDKVMSAAFAERLGDHLPNRVLPISTSPPQDMLMFLDGEFAQIYELLEPGKRRRVEARARLRHFMVMESNFYGDRRQPTEKNFNQAVDRLKKGDAWQMVFPGVATLQLVTQGHGLSVSLRFSREAEAAPVRELQQGESGEEEATLFREVNLLDRYSMGMRNLSQNLGLTQPKTIALVRYLELQNEPECFRVFVIGGSRYKRYSPEALRRLRESLPSVDIDAVWQEFRPRRRDASS